MKEEGGSEMYWWIGFQGGKRGWNGGGGGGGKASIALID